MLFTQPNYRGCAFANATAQAAPESVEVQAASIFRAWVHDLFLDLATDAGAADPKQLAQHLVLLYDGAVATSHMDKAPEAAGTARHTAELVLDQAGIRRPRATRAARAPRGRPRAHR